MCKKEGWKFVYLTGDTLSDHRTNAVRLFRDKEDVKILIAGLKCGGLGLNFPFANRCISLDLWWNHAVEQQAFGRIFRLGQAKETYMTRIAVRNTIDMRFLSVQLYKMRNCENAMQQRRKLGLAELMKLFGFLKTDENDNVVRVEPDYADEDDGEEEIGDADEPMPNMQMGGNGADSEADWSFGETIPPGAGSQNAASTPGSGSDSGAVAGPDSGTAVLSASGSGSGSGEVSSALTSDVGSGSKSSRTKVDEFSIEQFVASFATKSGASRDDPMEID
jgi:Helicase conserved C-terminal domain